MDFNNLLRSFQIHAQYIGNTFLCLFIFLFGARFLPHQDVPKYNLKGKTILVTGANSGLGFELAKQLSAHGGRVYMACRNLVKAHDAAKRIRKVVPDVDVHVVQLDTSSFASVRAFVDEWEAGNNSSVDLVFHNAGTGSVPEGRGFTEDGFEYLYQTNFLSSFLLTYLLERKGYLSTAARIIFTTSPGTYIAGVNHNFSLTQTKNVLEKGFHCPGNFTFLNLGNHVSMSSVYSNTKMMQVAFARALQNRYRRLGKSLTANAFSPGFAASEFLGTESFASMTFWSDPAFFVFSCFSALAMTCEQGVKTGVYLATDGTATVLGANAGGFWERMKRRTSYVDLLSDEDIDRLWIRWQADADIKWD